MLPGISTEQLRSRLNRMVADGMLTRKRYREVPPRVDYELTERARELLPVLGELARWGYEWAWSTPRNTEHVDLGAIFRLAPGLIDTTGLRGVVEFTVVGGKQDGEPATFSLSFAGQRVTIEEAPATAADAQVRGDTAAWISAFSPDGDRSQLEITGDQRLAERLLDGLGPHEARAEHTANAA